MKSQESLPVLTDGYDDDAGDRSLIKGEIAKCVDGVWSIKNGDVFPPKTQLLALSTATAVQHWKDKLPIEVILKVPGQPFPNVDDLNAAIPEEKWEKGIDDQPRPPYVKVEVVYLLDPKTASLYTHINSTVGTSIAVRHLRDKVKMMRMLRGNKVVPVVGLSSKPMPTKRGQKIRPHFEISDWRDFASLSAGTPVAATTTVPAIEHIGQPVKPPTSKEIFDDEMPDLDEAPADFEVDDDSEFVGEK